MAYANIAEWSQDQVADWLKGLNSIIAQYIPLFLAKGVKGEQLLTLRSDDLEYLGLYVIGHQELILEAVEHLRNFHYELERENLQILAMRLSCVATSLYNELRSHKDSNRVETQTLSDVAHVIAAVKPLAFWLDRSPFAEQLECAAIKRPLLELSLEAATCAQRDRFAERPTLAIAKACCRLAKYAKNIIQEMSDPMILQPASTDVVMLKRKESGLGFDIVPSFSGHHQIANIKFGSPAHASGKIEEGDEIVQVNYQNVIGWCPTSALAACGAGLSDELVLTLRRRPAARAAVHAPLHRPFRPLRTLRAPGTLGPAHRNMQMWDRDMMPALRFRVPSVEPTPEVEEVEENTSSEESDILSPPGSPTALNPMSSQLRLYLPKPRSQVQRRNTISGSSPISKRPSVSIEQFWQELKNQKSLNHTGSAQMPSISDHDGISNNLYRRDKALSYSTGLELHPRPNTCLGVHLHHPTIAKLKSKAAIIEMPKENGSADEAAKNRGKLDKSHSTPAYDFNTSMVEDEGSLMTQIIPESPTTPSADSPTIIIHSAQKVDQILDFKKSSSQIGEAIMMQQHKERKTSKGDMEVNESNLEVSSREDEHLEPKIGQIGQILETINIALMEHKNKDTERKVTTKQSTYQSHSIFRTEFGDKTTTTRLYSINEQKIQTIQNELVEAINDQRLTKAIKLTKTVCDTPPEPPPRPLSTQKPGYIPREYHIPITDNRILQMNTADNRMYSNDNRTVQIHGTPIKHHIQKRDIHVIPNIENSSPVIPMKRDIQLPIGNFEKTNFNTVSNPLTYERKHSNGNLSHVDLSAPRTPLSQARSLQRLELEGKSSSPAKTVEMSGKPSPGMESPKVTSPTNSVVRGIFPSAKSKSLKKKNSLLAKRRKVSVKDLGSGEMQGHVYQRCRTKNNTTVTWDLKWYILVGNTLYGFKSKEATKADCLIFLSGFTIAPAPEVKSKQFAFKVYHTGTAFYLAADTQEARNAWVEQLTRATMLSYDSWERAHKKEKKTDESKHYSETDYSDDDFLQESSDSVEKLKEGKVEKSEKSKFGSLKKFTYRSLHKTDSQENVSHSSTSLDRKYLRFFSSKSKNKEDKNKNKVIDIPTSAEQYRSYRKIPTSLPLHQNVLLTTQNLKDELNEKMAQNVKIKKIEQLLENKTIGDEIDDTILSAKPQKKIPTPINYIHASNPNLLDFEKSDFISKPLLNNPQSNSKGRRPENVMGFITLKEFMLQKQEEERKEVYSNRVLMGIERDARKEEKDQTGKKSKNNTNLQKQLDKIVPDVIYGELSQNGTDNIFIPTTVEEIQNRVLPKTPDLNVKKLDKPECSKNLISYGDDSKNNSLSAGKPISIKGRDGYEKIVYNIGITNIEDDYPDGDISLSESPKVLPRKPLAGQNQEILSTSRDRKCSESSVNELGYEIIYGDEDSPSQPDLSTSESINEFKSVSGNVSLSNSSRDLGYETIFGENDSSCMKKSATSLPLKSQDENKVTYPRRMSEDVKRSNPPKIMPKSKQVLNRQNSLTSCGNRNSGPDMNPVFVQGENPERFWMNSLRRNDKVYCSKPTENTKGEKFYQKRSEPSALMKSSEATIVKSERRPSRAEPQVLAKPLKSATQYKPVSLPIANQNKALKTSPQFELTLGAKEPSPPSTGIFRLKQIFQPGSSTAGSPSSSVLASSPTKERVLGSPRLHRALFRKHNSPSHSPPQSQNWTPDFTKTSPTSQTGDTPPNPSFTPSTPPQYSVPAATPPHYPHLECPPLFEAETYTLSDPATILRKKNNNSMER